MELIEKEEVYAIVGAAMEVHNTLSAGFSEAVYQESLAIEFRLRGIPFEEQKRLAVFYKGEELTCEFVADFVCFGSIIVEIKAIRSLSGKEESQVLNYLRATGLRVGILINFGDPACLDWHRFVN